MSPRAVLWLLCFALAPQMAQAWWNADYKQRTKITLNTSAAGVETKEALSGAVVPVRLHSGNFDFAAAKPDGSDIRVIAGDDKTPLKFALRRFDSGSELGVIWVQLPTVAPATDKKNTFYVYAGNPGAPAEQPAQVFDPATLAVFHFDDPSGMPRDAVGQSGPATGSVVTAAGMIGSAAQLDGRPLVWPPNDRLAAGPGAPYSLSLWLRPTGNSGTLLAQGALEIALDAGKLALRLGRVRFEGGTVPAGAWAQIAVTIGAGKAILYLDGEPIGQANVPSPAPAIEGPLRIGEGFSGLVDELHIAAVVRSPDWVRFHRAAEGADAKLIATVGQTDEGSSGSGGGYMGILVRNLTVDAWVVIAILGVMFIVAAAVMVSKTVLVTRTERDNRRFIAAFRERADVLAAAGAGAHPHSSLARLYDSGIEQLKRRRVGEGTSALGAAALQAVRAAVDSDLVRENHRLNARMVLLTIAISGGPFLGLLGTVVGVMITFAAIAAAGDVNVNAIAPGIAAALLATVAGLSVAIPSLFGYNWLSSRIKAISSDMQTFVDEWVTRVAEQHGQQ